MGRYIAKRCLYILVVFVILTFLLFSLYRLMPANRAYTDARAELQALKNSLSASERETKFDELYLKYQRLYGTDTDDTVILYLRWLGLYPFYDGKCNGIFQGNFGFSYEYNAPVIEVIGPHLRNSMLIGLVSEIFILGIKCAVKKNTPFDRGIQTFSLIGFSTPSFIIYILFILLFSSILGWFPVSGMKTPGSDYQGMKKVLDTLWHIALPTICLIFSGLAYNIRITRASMLDALGLDCIRTARAKGQKERKVIYGHGLRNALIPVVTQVGGQFGFALGGAMICETCFAIPGIGTYMVSGIKNRDYPAVQGAVLYTSIIFSLMMLVVDLAYAFIDPRIRAQYSGQKKKAVEKKEEGGQAA